MSMVSSNGNVQARVVYLYSHGIAASRHNVRQFLERYKKSNGIEHHNERYTIADPFVTFDYHDAWYWTTGNEWFLKQRQLLRRLIRGHYKNASLAQKADIDQLNSVYLEHKNELDRFILYGISRGGSTILAFLGRENPNSIAAAVVESLYASIDDIVEHKIKALRLQYLISKNMGLKLVAKVFKKYRPHGSKPVDWLPDVDPSVPILIVCSTSDLLVPWTSSYSIYCALRATGHDKVHILILHRGMHGFLIQGADGDKYQRVVHAFYKKYDLPYDPEIAALGEADFANCQPSIDG
jgi:Prolyl oligopeptidase family